MQEKKYTAPDKIVHKMSRDGLTEENLRTGEKQSIHEWQRSLLAASRSPGRCFLCTNHDWRLMRLEYLAKPHW